MSITENNQPKWDKDQLDKVLNLFFPIFKNNKGMREEDCKVCENLLRNIGEKTPLTFSQINQLLHLLHFGSISLGFFKYYFCTAPKYHIYKVSSIEGYEESFFEPDSPPIKTIKTIKQLNWGLHRFHIDALFFYGNINNAFIELRTKSEEALEKKFKNKRFSPLNDFKIRGDMFAFEAMKNNEKYLTSEIAYDALSNSSSPFKNHLLDNFDDATKNYNINKLVNKKDEFSTFREIAKVINDTPNLNPIISSKQDIENIHREILSIAEEAKIKAAKNFKLYLSITQQLDIYIATSMRAYDDFKNLSGNLKSIFDDPFFKEHNIRYFDPTNSASENHEDKGLAECLMVNCAKILVYFAGEKDSFGKDVEAAIALSLGKPVIIFCPDTPKGQERLKIFKDIHPLTRLTTVGGGVACGALVTKKTDDVKNILCNIIKNEMQYELTNDDGLFRLKEKVTGCTYRIQTNNELLASVFWNNYNE
ncbi:MAG TPA: hypothetical protein ENI61_01705 [Ignavibacteria bacterium]|nr:hypothetical protein [Ignavibacteria bacterium]